MQTPGGQCRGSPWSKTGAWSSGPPYNVPPHPSSVLTARIGLPGTLPPLSVAGPGTRLEGFRCSPSSWGGSAWHSRPSPNTAVEKVGAGPEICAWLTQSSRKVLTVLLERQMGMQQCIRSCNNSQFVSSREELLSPLILLGITRNRPPPPN